VSFYDIVGVDNDESWSDICKDIVTFVPLDQITKNFRLVQDIHLAHVLVEVTLGDFESLFEIGDHPYFALRSLCLVLNPFVFESFDGKPL
jgi:hypothetical protein